jgi:beta-lactamase superfamily II metal-dependent hydrolase
MRVAEGGLTSSVPELLLAVQPQVAAISVGTGDTYGHPRIVVLAPVSGSRSEDLSHGSGWAVIFYLDGRSVSPELAALR